MKLKNQFSEKILISSIAAGMALTSPFTAVASSKPKVVSSNFNTNQVFQYGHIGEEIKKLQTELNSRDYYKDTIDGYFGDSTMEAIKQFQEDHSLRSDGIAGPVTLTLLFKNPETKKYLEEVNKKFLTIGDEGDKVVELQEKLKEYDYYKREVDGIYGNGTETAVIRFQQQHDLKVDGIAGEEVFNQLSSNHVHPYKPKRVVKTQTQTKSKKIKTEAVGSVNTGVIGVAKQFLGTPYRWGGESPSGFDCSGFLNYVYYQAGKTIPRTVSDIWNFATPVGKPSVGDLVFFETYKPGPSHAGIYLGNNKFIHAGSSSGVSISDMSASYWSSRYLGAKRIVQ